MRSLFFLLGLMVSVIAVPYSALAEYRVFNLVITDNNTQQQRSVASTLDPYQYVTYYPLKTTESIVYTDSWMCYGYTAKHKPLCPNPKQN